MLAIIIMKVDSILLKLDCRIVV